MNKPVRFIIFEEKNMSNFEDIFHNCAEKTKLKFLDLKIRHNHDLQEEFRAFLDSEKSAFTPVPSDDFIRMVNLVREKYKNLFEKVDIENPDWDNYVPPHSGYIEDWETYRLASEQEFERIFADFASDATDKIISHNTVEVMAMLVGLYEATQDAVIQDDVCSFDDVNEFLLDDHGEVLTMIADKLNLSAVSGNNTSETIRLFINYCDSEYPGNPHFPACFESLLLVLADKSDQPGILLETINKSEVDIQSVARLILLLLKKSENNEEWVKAARLYYRENRAIARDLLEYYFRTDNASFLATARELFPTNKREWSEFLQYYLVPENDRDLFVQVFRELTACHSSLEYYHKIKKLLTTVEYEQLLSQVGSNKPFIVSLLAEEKRYDEIKRLVEKYPSDWEYLAMIEPILTIFPAFCFENIRSRVSKTLANERGRPIYEKIASWLKIMKTIPGFDAEKQNIIHITYNHKPNLPALRDEMRNAGLI